MLRALNAFVGFAKKLPSSYKRRFRRKKTTSDIRNNRFHRYSIALVRFSEQTKRND